MKLKYDLFLYLFVSFACCGCYKDDSSTGGNEIMIPKIENSTEQEMNIYLGDEIVITPDVDEGGTEATYQWSIGKYSASLDEVETTVFKEISADKELRYKMLDLGHFRVRLSVTNRFGSTIKYYDVNINTEYEEGYLVFGCKENGHGSVAFMKTLTPEEIGQGMKPEFKSGCYFYVNGEELPADPIDCYKVDNYLFLAFGESQKVYMIDFKSFQLYHRFDLDVLAPSLVPVKMVAHDSRYTCKEILLLGKNGAVGNLKWLQFEVFDWLEIPQDKEFDEIFWRREYSSARVMCFVDRDKGSVYLKGTGPDGTGYFPTFDYFEGHRVLQVFFDRDEQPHVIWQEGNQYKVTKLYRRIGLPDADGRLAISVLDERTLNDRAALLKDGDVLVNDNTSSLFYYEGNKIYRWMFNQHDLPTEPFITLPEGEVVTTISNKGELDHAEIYIGSYNASRQGLKGSFYRYDPETGAQLAAYEGIADRPVSVLYKIR